MQHATIGRDARHEAGPATPAFVAAQPALPPAAFDSEVLALLCPDWHDAMMVVDAVTREVAYANIRALEMLKRRHPLMVNRGCLELSETDGTDPLGASLRQIVETDVPRSSIIVDDEPHGMTYGVRLCLPQGFLRDVLRRNLAHGGRLVVLEVVTGKMTLSLSDLNALGSAFGLTSAELSVLSLLAQGRSLHEIAELRGVEFETVRNQNKKLLAKTRSRRQSDLVKLVVALCARDGFVPE
jgi:DNA-binding CsgD family transcriptional regulator